VLSCLHSIMIFYLQWGLQFMALI